MAKKKHANSANGAVKAIDKAVGGQKKKMATRADIPIDHVLPCDQRATYANHFAVQHEGGVYHLMFFQINPPLTLGTHEEKAKALREIKSVQAVCHARIIVADEFMPKLITAMVENYNTQQARAAGQVELVDVSESSVRSRKETA